MDVQKTQGRKVVITWFDTFSELQRQSIIWCYSDSAFTVESVIPEFLPWCAHGQIGKGDQLYSIGKVVVYQQPKEFIEQTLARARDPIQNPRGIAEFVFYPDGEDGEECAAATKMRRCEDSEEGQTRIVTGGCHDPKPADAPTPTTVPAADESSTGNNLQGDCADAPDSAPRKELVGVENAKQIGAMKPPTKKRSASCRGEDGEDDEDGEECAAATKLRRGEDGEEGQTRIVTGACYDPRFDPDRIEEVYTRKKGWVFRRRLERL